MNLLVAGLVLFLGVHSISIVAAQWRDRTAQRIGRTAWRGVYSVLSLIGLVLIVKGYAAARMDPTVLWIAPHGLRLASLVLLLFVFPLFLAAYFPGRIKARIAHPMLIGVKVWAFAHLLANGTLADALLFGSFLVWAVVDRVSMMRRPTRPVPTLPPAPWNDAIAVAGGLVLYVAFALWLHPWLIGVAVTG